MYVKDRRWEVRVIALIGLGVYFNIFFCYLHFLFQFDKKDEGDHVPYLLVRDPSCNDDDYTVKGTVLVSTHLEHTCSEEMLNSSI
jgi:hypothetical protein